MPLPWNVRPALVLLVLLMCSSAAVHAAPDPMVEAIQRALVERGFDPGEVDGLTGWRTRDALKAFQRSVGLPDTGRADDETLTALGLEPPGAAPAEADSDTREVTTPQAEAVRVPDTDAPKTGTPGAEPGTERDADTPGTGMHRTETAPTSGMRTPQSETPSVEPTTEPATDTSGTGTPRTETAPTSDTDTPQSETPSVEPTAEPATDTSGTGTPRARPAPTPVTDTPQSETPSVEPTTEPATDTSGTGTPRTETAPTSDTDTPQSETPSVEPTAEPATDTSGTKASRAETAPTPDMGTPQSETPSAESAPVTDTVTPKTDTSQARPEAAPSADTNEADDSSRTGPAPKPAAGSMLSFAALGWHRPQTGPEALERLDAIGTPRNFRRGTGSFFVPKAELVFVLRAGQRVPGLDCDPGAGQLTIEFVFGPDGPVIFTPTAGGEYCQMGIGIAIEVGRTLEMRPGDWDDVKYPRGTVRITSEGLEYIR